MLNTVIAMAYIVFAISAATFLLLRSCPSERAMIRNGAIAWLLVTFFMLFSPHPTIWLGASAIVLLWLAPKEVPDRLMFYCIALPIAPIYLGWEIPFPGMNYLMRLFYPVFLNLVLLLPIVFQRVDTGREDASRTHRQRWILLLASAFVLVCSLLDFRETSFTNGLRLSFQHFLSVGLIALAFAKAADYEGSSRKILLGVMIGGGMMACIGIMQQITGWLIYSEAPNSLIVTQVVYQHWIEYRNGMLRIPGTMNAIPFGILMGLCLSISIYETRNGSLTGWGWVLAFVFAYGIFGSDSRGAMLMVVLILVAYLFYYSPLPAVRIPCVLASLAMLLALFTTDLGKLLVAGEEHGTLGYRVDLVANSMDAITSSPILGSPDYLENEQLQDSYQGQGIIDIVNSYLQILLRYGAVGLLLFLLPMKMALTQAKRSARRNQSLIEDKATFARFCASLLFGYAVAILSVSLVDRLMSYYWILVLICAAIPVSRMAGAGLIEARGMGAR